MKVGEVQEVWCKKLRVASVKRLFVLKRAAVAAHGSVEEGDAMWRLPQLLLLKEVGSANWRVIYTLSVRRP